jgi:hypothetical protein
MYYTGTDLAAEVQRDGTFAAYERRTRREIGTITRSGSVFEASDTFGIVTGSFASLFEALESFGRAIPVRVLPARVVPTQVLPAHTPHRIA